MLLFFPHKKFPCVTDIFKIMILINILRVREWKGYIVVMLLYVKIKFCFLKALLTCIISEKKLENVTWIGENISTFAVICFLGWLKNNLIKLCGAQVPCFGVLGISKLDPCQAGRKPACSMPHPTPLEMGICGRLQSNCTDTS